RPGPARPRDPRARPDEAGRDLEDRVRRELRPARARRRGPEGGRSSNARGSETVTPGLQDGSGDLVDARSVAFSAHRLPRRDRKDPWEAVLSLGDRAVKIGLVIGLFLALGTHGSAAVRALTGLYDMEKAVGAMRASIHEFLWTEYDIDLRQE